MKWLAIVALCCIQFGCSKKIQIVSTPYDANAHPAPPDYSKSEHWASLPGKKDAADSVPLNSSLHDKQSTAQADVFFVYPTIYTGKLQARYPWNADLNNVELTKDIQRSSILNQASIFNGSCRVYAPYYRQAHLYSFYTTDKEDASLALNLAYEDVKSAFQFYLDHYNQGRPIVIASHSQGSYHTMRLLQDFFDGKPLGKQLVIAYLVGRAISRDAFETIKPSKAPEEIGVWASWNTFSRDYKPATYDSYYREALSTNPLLWNSSEEFASKELNSGGVGLKFTMVPHLADAQNHANLLWINKPYVKGRGLLRTKVWHRADMNLFYNSIRNNVALRIENFINLKGTPLVQEIH